MAKDKSTIKKNSSIQEIYTAYPESAVIMRKYGLHCIGCSMSMFETIEQGARAHGVSEKEIDEMVKEINVLINKKK